jgi:hypothetical protein
MVIPGFIEQATGTADHARSGLFGGKDQLGDAGVDHSAGAHGAGLKRDVESRTGQAVITLGPGGITQGDYFGMGRWILRCDNLVPALSQQLAIAHHDGTNRDFTLIGRPIRQRQGATHPSLVVFQGWHSGYSHSIINCPPKSSDDAGFPEPAHLNTMKNTMLNNSWLITCNASQSYLVSYPFHGLRYFAARCGKM